MCWMKASKGVAVFPLLLLSTSKKVCQRTDRETQRAKYCISMVDLVSKEDKKKTKKNIHAGIQVDVASGGQDNWKKQFFFYIVFYFLFNLPSQLAPNVWYSCIKGWKQPLVSFKHSRANIKTVKMGSLKCTERPYNSSTHLRFSISSDA